MDNTNIAAGLVTAYTTVALWCFENQIATDLIILGFVLGSLMFLARRTLRMRRLAHRVRWGVGMKKSKNREAFERGLISFGICDAIEEAVARGDMTRERANQWYVAFANDYNMTELLPRPKNKAEKEESLKNAINKRIQIWEKLKIIIPGAAPGVKVDPAYQPVVAVGPNKGKVRSKYSS